MKLIDYLHARIETEHGVTLQRLTSSIVPAHVALAVNVTFAVDTAVNS
jgi:hypothetical protein